jgi:hypothetical protein
MSYREQAFSYVASQGQTIKDVAQALGISETAIAGAMAEEHDSFWSKPDINLSTDAYAADWLRIHDDIANAAPHGK